MKQQLKFLAFGLALTVGTAAQAVMPAGDYQTFDLGDLPVTGTVADAVLVPVGYFEHTFIFDVTAPTFSAGSISDLPLTVNAGLVTMNLYNIDDLSVTLHASDGSLINNLGTGDYLTGSGTFPVADDYYYLVTGTGAGDLGGQYVYAVTTLAVPEPESWAMLLAGLGLVGLQLRRKMAASSTLANS